MLLFDQCGCWDEVDFLKRYSYCRRFITTLQWSSSPKIVRLARTLFYSTVPWMLDFSFGRWTIKSLSAKLRLMKLWIHWNIDKYVWETWALHCALFFELTPYYISYFDLNSSCSNYHYAHEKSEILFLYVFFSPSSSKVHCRTIMFAWIRVSLC